jgi:glutathione S-transferase
MMMYSLSLAGACAKRVLGMDLLGDFPEAKTLLATLGERESAKQIAADQKG